MSGSSDGLFDDQPQADRHQKREQFREILEGTLKQVEKLYDAWYELDQLDASRARLPRPPSIN